MQDNHSTERSRRSRTAREQARKAGSSGMLLTTGAFLIVICVILYGVYASHKDAGPKQLEAAKPPAADTGAGAQQGQAANSDAAANGNDGGTGAANTADAPDAAGSSDAANAADAGQANESSDAGDAPSAGEPAAPIDGGASAADTSADTGTGTAPAADKPEEPVKQPAADTGGKAPSTASHTAQSKLPTTYVVKKGDTLSTISLQFYHSKQYVAFLAERNGIAFVNDMKVGDTIRIPALTPGAGSVKGSQASADYASVKLPATYLVRPGDTLYRISVLFYQSGDYASFLAKQNGLDEKEGLKAGISLRIPAKPAAK